MNLIRAILPGGKHRMMSEGFKSLDIAKITPRMYAMSYPSENLIESMYHNNQDDIANYLNKNHPKKYLIFNLSGIPYEQEKFNNSVIDYFWPDHKAPPLYDIFKIIFQAYNYLGKDKENVICVHCLAGKGRTGTICCSLLLYGRLFKCSDDANNYFSTKRFKKLNRGVQEPSQVRYIKYFDKMLDPQRFKGLSLKMYEIKKVFITGVKMNDGESLTYKIETDLYKENDAQFYLSKDKGQIVQGDVTINIYRNDSLKAWVVFNTFFIEPQNNRLFYHIKDIDPRFLLKQADYNLMTIEIVLYPYPQYNQNQNMQRNSMCYLNTSNNFNHNNNMNNNLPQRNSMCYLNLNNNNQFNNMNNNMNNSNNFNNNFNQYNNMNNNNNFNQNNNNNNNGNFNNFNQNNNNFNNNNFNNNNFNNNNFNNNNFNNNNFNNNNFNNNNCNNNNMNINQNQNNFNNFNQNNNNPNNNNNMNFNQNQNNFNNFNQNNNNPNNNNNMNQNQNNFNNFNQNNNNPNYNNNMNQNQNNFSQYNNNNNNNNMNQNQNNFNNFNQNNNNNNNNNFNQNQNNFNNFNQNNNNNNNNNMNQNQNNFNQNNNNNNNNFNQNQNNFNNFNHNQNQNNINNNGESQLINEMIGKAMERIKEMNKYLYYANTKNSGQFYKENKFLFFGDEEDDTVEVLNQIKSQK